MLSQGTSSLNQMTRRGFSDLYSQGIGHFSIVAHLKTDELQTQKMGLVLFSSLLCSNPPQGWDSAGLIHYYTCTFADMYLFISMQFCLIIFV